MRIYNSKTLHVSLYFMSSGSVVRHYFRWLFLRMRRSVSTIGFKFRPLRASKDGMQTRFLVRYHNNAHTTLSMLSDYITSTFNLTLTYHDCQPRQFFVDVLGR